MATAAKKGATKPDPRIPRVPPPNGLRGEGRDLPIGLIGPSRFNPRKDFPAEEIEELAATIATHGLLQPIVVRPVDDPKKNGCDFELIAGERRLRAAKKAGLETIAALVRDADDRQAAELCVLENLQRKDLNAIEEARGFRMLLNEGKGMTQTELAARPGMPSQPQIANRLRLLKLPAAWQKRIISGEIPPTHALYVLPYSDHPTLLAAIAKSIHGEPVGSVAEFRQKIDWAVRLVRLEKKSKGWKAEAAKKTPPKNLTTAHTAVQRRKQQAEEDKGMTQTELAARPGMLSKPQIANRLRLLKLPAPQIANRLRLLKLPAAWQERIISGEIPLTHALYVLPYADHPTLLAAIAKSIHGEPVGSVAEFRQKIDSAIRLEFRRRLYDWKINWLRYLIAGSLEDCSDEDLVRVLLCAAVAWPLQLHGRFDAILQKILHTKDQRQGQPWRKLANLDDHVVPGLGQEFAASLFYHETNGPVDLVPAETVEAMAKHFGIDLQNSWFSEQAGPLSESYWNLHTKDQLAALANDLELTMELPAGLVTAKKAAAVKWFLDQKPGPDDKEVGLPMPKEIAKAKRPR